MERDTVVLLQRNMHVIEYITKECIELKPDAKHEQQSPRTVPEEKEDAYKKELERL